MTWTEIKSNIDALDEKSLRKFLYSQRMIESGFSLLIKAADYLRIKKEIDKSLNVLDMTMETCDSVKKLIGLLYLRGDVYMDDERYIESVTCYTLIIELKPHNLDVAYNNRGVAYWEMDKYQQARSDFEAAISLNPKNKTALYGAGEMCLLADDYAKAEKCFKSALEIDPTYSNAKEALMRMPTKK